MLLLKTYAVSAHKRSLKGMCTKSTKIGCHTHTKCEETAYVILGVSVTNENAAQQENVSEGKPELTAAKHDIQVHPEVILHACLSGKSSQMPCVKTTR